MEEIKKESPFPVGEENAAYAQYFAGRSYLSSLSTQQLGISNVTFEPGCRNNWHIHHGAAPDSWFSHIAIAVPGENSRCEWLEAAADEQKREKGGR